MVHKLKERGLGDRVSVASCATSTEEIVRGIGNPVYPPAKHELARHGISCDGKRAVQLKKSDYACYDSIVCMDGYNVRNALRILGGDPEHKVTKLMDHTDRGGDPDGACVALFDRSKATAENRGIHEKRSCSSRSRAVFYNFSHNLPKSSISCQRY